MAELSLTNQSWSRKGDRHRICLVSLGEMDTILGVAKKAALRGVFCHLFLKHPSKSYFRTIYRVRSIYAKDNANSEHYLRNSWT